MLGGGRLLVSGHTKTGAVMSSVLIERAEVGGIGAFGVVAIKEDRLADLAEVALAFDAVGGFAGCG